MISTFTAFFDANVFFGARLRSKAARDDLRHYANPPLTVDAYLNDLRRAGVPNTADHLGRFKILLEGDQADSNP